MSGIALYKCVLCRFKMYKNLFPTTLKKLKKKRFNWDNHPLNLPDSNGTNSFFHLQHNNRRQIKHFTL